MAILFGKKNSRPGLSWDALLKKTGVELELLTDYDQHLFIEKGMRGGISMVSKRYAKANNPTGEGYDSSKPKSHILYLDANNLYGWAMSQPLPTGSFRWVDDDAGLAETIADHPADSREGYILEVDLEYPEELHETHNAYPLASERMVARSTSTASQALGPRSKSWSQISATRAATCFITAICSSTCIWASA